MPLLLATVESSTSSVPAVIRVLPLNVLLPVSESVELPLVKSEFASPSTEPIVAVAFAVIVVLAEPSVMSPPLNG